MSKWLLDAAGIRRHRHWQFHLTKLVLQCLSTHRVFVLLAWAWLTQIPWWQHLKISARLSWTVHADVPTPKTPLVAPWMHGSPPVRPVTPDHNVWPRYADSYATVPKPKTLTNPLG